MKIQSLSIIFIIIIMPITIVLSEYVNNKIEGEVTELQYNTKLINSTYDAIKAYQLNTVNNAFGDVTNKKIQDIEAAAKTLYNSLASNFNYTGYRSEVMKEYVPAIVFRMYDGYYIYSPFTNALTEVSSYDTTYSNDGKTQSGLKPYVYYTCRYTNTASGSSNLPMDTDFSIIYTLDNYITIQGKIGGKYVYDNGYLHSIVSTKAESDSGKGIYKENDNSYWYNGVNFRSNDTEELKEYVGSAEYSYVKINGKKYYLDENYYTDRGRGNRTVNGVTFKASSGIFFIDSNGTKNYSQVKGYSNDNMDSDNKEFLKYYKAIKYNKSAYKYYKNAYEFSKAVLGSASAGYKDKSGNATSGYNLSRLKTNDAVHYNDSSIGTNTTSLSEYGVFNVFGTDANTNIENSTSKFNQHRKSIIRYTVETNLSSAIASFSSSKTTNFFMPKISETDWETIENDVCAISFLQGMSIGSKKYNGYAVVANTLTKEYIDENDIYILKTDNTYCKVNDKTIETNSSEIVAKSTLGYYAGVWKLNFEQRQGIVTNGSNEETVYYNPVKYYGSYTSIMGSYGRNSIVNTDMYKYILNKNSILKKAYLVALGRERWGAYNVNNINYELYNNTNGNEYFLADY